MASDPRKILQHRQKERALELGRVGNPAALSELTALLKSPFAEVRRLAASAIGKLAEAKAAEGQAAAALLGPAMGDPHPQVQQYSLKALARYPRAACLMLDRLRDVARNATFKPYVRTAAAETMIPLLNSGLTKNCRDTFAWLPAAPRRSKTRKREDDCRFALNLVLLTTLQV